MSSAAAATNAANSASSLDLSALSNALPSDPAAATDTPLVGTPPKPVSEILDHTAALPDLPLLGGDLIDTPPSPGRKPKRQRRPYNGPPEFHPDVLAKKEPYRKKTRAERKINNPLRPVYYPEYIFEDGLRRVKPYFFTYNTFCKERWRGKTLLEVFTTEFRDRPVEYYVKAIETGQVFINGKDKSTAETIINDGDYISHNLHRHEPPVSGKPIGIVHEDDGLIVIDKPAGIPVHPAGRYFFNSVMEIMRWDRQGKLNPLPCNRLDRLTSGLMFVAKNRERAEAIMTQMKERTLKKEYIARVKGNFPDGDITVDQPILAISPKLALNMVKADGKQALTSFRKIRYDAERDFSIVRCFPKTGRTHQIRVHLQFLGHPITNDPIYSNRRVFGPNLGKGGEGNEEDILSRLEKMGREEVALALDYYDEMMDNHNKRKAEMMTGETCPECGTPLFSDPGDHELGIYLHAKRYECEEGKWAYETSMPDWA